MIIKFCFDQVFKENYTSFKMDYCCRIEHEKIKAVKINFENNIVIKLTED